jgi:5-methylcytosine-specific restriction protein B
MVDYALRRRFTFVDLKPAFESAEFRSFLADREVESTVIDLIVERMTELNGLIRSEKTNLGPGFMVGHSYFCPQETEQELGIDWYRSVIKSEIAPLVREYWFDATDKADKLIARLLTC